MSDRNVTLAQIRKWCNKVREARGWHPDARSLAISMVLEVGEILEHFQWEESVKVEESIKNSKAKKEEIAKEVGDVVNYLCEFVDRLDIDISDSLKKTLKKVKEKYPAKKIKRGGMEFYYKQKKKYRKGTK